MYCHYGLLHINTALILHVTATGKRNWVFFTLGAFLEKEKEKGKGRKKRKLECERESASSIVFLFIGPPVPLDRKVIHRYD